ncbi:MAG: hypothetical protein D3914_14435 [Candidatus Electrothrix sp. LOE2]|nr:hypothetical protein [Candidatus Electrothrix sp. LOE2]
MITGERYRAGCVFSLQTLLTSGSPNAGNSDNAWNVNFNNGNSNNDNRDNNNAVRLVRGGKWQEGADGFFFCA